MDERNSQYEFQPSRNGLTVPVINGVYLHSIYNPIKEAEAFAKGHEQNLIIKNKVLVLGLGFGYHIEEIAKILNTHHKTFEIVILEPNQKLVEDFIDTRNFEDSNIKIISKSKVKDLFEDWQFIEFLMQRPCIIKHDTSFILEKDFYTRFLGYQASKEIFHFKNLLTEDSKKLFTAREARTVDSYIENIRHSGMIKNQNEFFLMAFNEVIQNNTKGVRHE